MLEIGDVLRLKPAHDNSDIPQRRLCRVVYIHPENRYYTVRFETELGWGWLESFYFAGRMTDFERGKVPTDEDENDRDYEQQRRRRKNRHRH